jgi:hypothetical protein
LQLDSIDLSMASPEDRRRIYQALRLEVTVDEERTIRLSGVFSPDVYLPNVLKGPPDISSPRPQVPEGSRVVVTSDSTPRPDSQ